MLRQSQVRVLLSSLLICSCLSLALVFYLATKDCNSERACHCDIKFQEKPNNKTSGHKLCVIVPFKDRFEELLQFAPYMKEFLQNQNVENDIWVVHQVDKYRFNRASLINVGFKESVSASGCDYIAMHDVDLLPQNPKLLYSYPAAGPYHMASPELHPKYDYPTFIGGILLLSVKHFKQVDGMSNKYWGWGLEDDEFFVRLRQANLPIERPRGIRSGRSGTFLHLHSTKERKRDTEKCYNQRNATRRRDRLTGLSNTFYTVKAKRDLKIDGADVHMMEVELECDRSVSPWCDCKGAPPDNSPADRSRDEDVVVPLLPKKKNKKKPKDLEKKE